MSRLSHFLLSSCHRRCREQPLENWKCRNYNSLAFILTVSNVIVAGNTAMRSEDKQQYDFDYLLAQRVVISVLATLKLIE